MLISPLVILGEEKDWPEELGVESPIFFGDIARKAKLHPRTLKNAINGSHAPAKTTLDGLSAAFSKISGVEIPPDCVQKFIARIQGIAPHRLGYWELTLRNFDSSWKFYDLKPLVYSRRLIIAQERAYYRFLRKRAEIGEARALAQLFCDEKVNAPYLENVGSRDASELRHIYMEWFIRVHVSGIAAIEAELRAFQAQDSGPKVSQFLPVICDQELIGPVSRYLTLLMDKFGLENDFELIEKIASEEKFEGLIRQLSRWRKTKFPPIKTPSGKKEKLNKRTGIPGWRTINGILDDLDVGVYKAEALMAFGVSRYLQVVLNKSLTIFAPDGDPVVVKSVVGLFGEYEKWYRFHSLRIREHRAD